MHDCCAALDGKRSLIGSAIRWIAAPLEIGLRSVIGSSAIEVPGQIGTLFPYIHPSAHEVAERLAGDDPPPIDAVTEQNVRHQVHILREASPVLASLGRKGKLKVVGGVFHFETGWVEIIEA